MNDEFKFPSLFAAIASGTATVGTALASVALPPGDTGKFFEWLAAVMAAGFLYFVRKWMKDREDADSRLMETIRKHIDQQLQFEESVTRFMGLVIGHLGLHGVDWRPTNHEQQKATESREEV